MTKWECDWAELNPAHAAKVLCGLEALEKKGIDVVIPKSGGKRSQTDQAALYAKGRTKPGSIVTDCDGLNKKSKHQLGIATDIVPADKYGNASWPPFNDPRWKEIRYAMVEQGLIAGQDWIDFPDYPHYESKGV